MKRAKPDPNIQVKAMQMAFEEFMVLSKTRDLSSLMKDAVGLRFKMAPVPEVLVGLSPLLHLLLQVAPNGCLPRAKLASAIAGCHCALPCNFTKEPMDTWSQRIGELTRVLCTHLRKLQLPEDKELAYKKVTSSHIIFLPSDSGPLFTNICVLS